jgi:hypothetical protein
MDEIIRFQIPVDPDEDGYFGRECPKCESYFKIVNGTGLTGEELPCRCPYCGHVDSMDQFWTNDQIEYAKSHALRQFGNLLHDELKKSEFNHKAQGPFGIGVSLTVERGDAVPIRYYREKQLETRVICDNCTLQYAVYGVFAFCPDCGRRNYLDILKKNLQIIGAMIEWAETLDGELREKVIENALEDCVSSFDGFGREICRVFAEKSLDPDKARRISFQNLDRAKEAMKSLFGIDISQCVSAEDWVSAKRSFQKRHLIAHKMGVIDAEYVEKTKDSGAIVGRKISIDVQDIESASTLVESVGECLAEHLAQQDATE